MDIATLIIWLLLGIPVMIQYFYYLPRNYNTVSKDELWAWTPKELRYTMMVSIGLSFLSGLYMLWYTIEELPKHDVYGYDFSTRSRYYVYLALFLMLFFSNFWWSMMYYKRKSLVTTALVMAGIGSILLMSQVWNSVLDSEKITDKLAIGASFVLMFQMTIMDAIVWNVFYNLK